MRFAPPNLLLKLAASFAVAVMIALVVNALRPQIRYNFFAYGDLRAFYCSARVASSGFDPYRAEPLGACERDLVGMPHGNFVVPAPLPGQAIALFEPLARLPFSEAAPIWATLLAIVYFALSVMLTRLTGLPYGYSLLALFPLAIRLPISLGQLVPVAIALLVAGALALRRGHDTVAGLLSAMATIEPHIGLPVCLALFVQRPRSRPALLLGAVALVALGTQTVGTAGMLEYLVRVLPVHIAAEAHFDDQYSLTYLLSTLHVPMTYAVTMGQFSYWGMMALGIWFALRLTSVTADPRFLVLVPMAFSVIGGPFVHQEHLLAAVPLTALVVMTSHRDAHRLALISLALIAWPAEFILQNLQPRSIVVLISTARLPDLPGPGELADSAWALRIAPNADHLAFFVAKVPVWVGLLLLLGLIAFRAGARRGQHRVLEAEQSGNVILAS